MSTIPQVAEAMQEVLTAEADRLGRESGFVRRVRKLDGSRFIETLVFGFWAKPDAGYEQLSQTAAIVGCPHQCARTGAAVYPGCCPVCREVSAMTPLEAINKLFEFQRRAGKK